MIQVVSRALMRLRARTGADRSATPLRERFIELGLLSSGALSVLITAGILGVLAFETLSFFSRVSLSEFFGDTRWTPLFTDKHFGIWPLVAGTLLTSAIAIAVALPLGLLAAIYLSEFASPRARRILKPTLELLAGIPTIVYGYFALVFVTPILQTFVPDLAGFNALSPGIVMGFMIMPMISSLSEDALYAVPNSMREAGYALGSAKLPTILRVVVPSATSGIVAAVTLAISRAIGETMVVTIAAGQQPNFTLDPRVPIETMTAFIISISKGDTPTGTLEFRTIFAVSSMLFLMTFAMNLVSHRMARRLRYGAARS
jgi:phosphate transport system permease protein